MTLIRSVHVLIYTADEEGAGTDGDVYVGAAGREFHLDTGANDFERGTHFVYRFGTFPTVINTEANDPQRQRLLLESIDSLPLYIRFAPSQRDDRWKLERAVVAFNSEETPLWDSDVNAPDGIWLDMRAGLVLHLPRVPAIRPVLPGRQIDLHAELFADNSSGARPAGPRTPSIGSGGEAYRLVESRARYVPPIEAVRPEGASEPIRPASAAEALKSFETSPAAQTLMAQVPGLRDTDAWDDVASLTVCDRFGTARDLSVRGGTAFILDDHSLSVWGSGQWPPVTRVGCGFDAPAEGLFMCSVRLRSWDPRGAAVECRIDGESFGITQIGHSPTNHVFLTRLGAGYHQFATYEVGGSPFLFFSFSVWHVPINLPT
jgi:hypothetical protein